ncbi:ATP-binding cassette domain-containing protein [Propionibacterium freudenreichii]|uniref:ATP-binding cassette domain-containing protein n=1 Tax=Propionibacterium freudenreichii TaxID=1744 RepID=UPI0005424D4F|nr:ATP-binding cassette domain-containing protein [Propionibacterium freudenreichii]CEG94383.1 ABC 2 protein of drug ABC transporter (DRI:YHIH) [Propionibacterium freudenreichii]
MITLRGASVHFGARRALDDFSGSFAPGQVTALVGGDGAGKSTLLRVLTGRVAATPAQPGAVTPRTQLGYMPADAGVWNNLSVAQNIAFVARVFAMSPEQTRERSQLLLARAGLAQVGDREAGKLSGGMRQKLGFVLATLHSPSVVLLDEPTTGVDPVSRGEIWSLIAGAAAEGATVVFATTYLDEAERCDQLFLLDQGRLVTSGTADEVIASCPGTVWQAPADAGAGADTDDVPRATSWRRGDQLFAWTPSDREAPAGFAASVPDLENTSIALLLAGGATLGADSLDDAATAPGHPRASDAPVVLASRVTKTFGDFTALHDVSLAVHPGEIVGLLGGNGAGKTTLMRCVLGLEQVASGRVLLFGQVPSIAVRRRLGYVAQGLGLYPTLSATENLRFTARVFGARSGGRQFNAARGARAGARLGERALAYAHDLGRSPVGALPLGARRMLAYLCAIEHDPELLVLDEPTSGMDPLSRARLWRELREVADRGVGILVSTHYMAEAAQCDRLEMLTAGHVSASGSVADITAGRRSLVVHAPQWQRAFALLRDADLPVALDRRMLRVPGASRDEIARVLDGLAGGYSVTEAASTLEETMMLAERGGDADGK